MMMMMMMNCISVSSLLAGLKGLLMGDTTDVGHCGKFTSRIREGLIVGNIFLQFVKREDKMYCTITV